MFTIMVLAIGKFAMAAAVKYGVLSAIVLLMREMLLAVADMVQGAQISAPMGRYSSAVDVLEALGTQRRAAVP